MGDAITKACFGTFNRHHRTQRPKSRAIFVSVFQQKPLIAELDWPSWICGLNVMAKNIKFGKTSNFWTFAKILLSRSTDWWVMLAPFISTSGACGTCLAILFYCILLCFATS